ncbi:MAG: YajQ family cyclic di-GMP-binding protein [bacterium]
MADEFSFDVVSKVDMHAVEDAVNVANKEIANRYDFKGSNSSITLDIKENKFNLSSSDEYKIKALYDVLLTRLSKRGVPLKNLEPEKIETALAGTVKQFVKIQQGIPSEKAKEMVRLIKDKKLKVTAAIQADQLRISSRSKDELQNAMALLKSGSFGLDLQFTNYR